MRHVGVALTFGRQSCCALLDAWAQQTITCPLFLWADDAPDLELTSLPSWCTAHAGGRLGTNSACGAVRAAATDAAIARYALSDGDVLLVVDDDDHYSPDHVQRTLSAMIATKQTFVAAGRFGLMQSPDEIPPLLVDCLRADLSGAIGTHATWGYTVARYRASGGYGDVDPCDLDLVTRMGLPALHRHVTHVRRQYGPQLSQTVVYDRARLRRESDLVQRILPIRARDADRLDAWCKSDFASPMDSEKPREMSDFSAAATRARAPGMAGTDKGEI